MTNLGQKKEIREIQVIISLQGMVVFRNRLQFWDSLNVVYQISA